MRLRDKTALITGAGSGIGRAIALEFAREGAKVLVAELNEAAGQAVVDEIGAAGGEARLQRCDVAKEAEVQAAIQAAVDAFGRLDIMVNNAGVGRSDWATTLAITLSGVYYGCKHAAETMAAQGGGSPTTPAPVPAFVGFARAAVDPAAFRHDTRSDQQLRRRSDEAVIYDSGAARRHE